MNKIIIGVTVLVVLFCFMFDQGMAGDFPCFADSDCQRVSHCSVVNHDSHDSLSTHSFSFLSVQMMSITVAMVLEADHIRVDFMD